jgi:N-acetylneuraminate 9-O-acetyltransferase
MHVMYRVLSLDPGAVLEHKATLDAAAEFASWMLWFFVADRTKLLPAGQKEYSRDVVLTIFASTIFIAFKCSWHQEERMLTLSRPQTEEWKGWMQVVCHVKLLPMQRQAVSTLIAAQEL